MNEVFDDPQVQHLGMATAVPTPQGDTVSLVAPAFSLSRTPPRMRHTLGVAGADNVTILHELGLSDEDIAALVRDQVI